MEEVVALAGQEITKLMRAAAQIGRFLAEQRRRQLYQQAQRSAGHARNLRAIMNQERVLAAPVYRRALDQRFWQTANAPQASFVYGLATRFATLDPVAEQAARICEVEAHNRWNVHLGELQQASEAPVTSKDLGPGQIEALAPKLQGEPAQQWDRVLDEAAKQERSQAANPDPAAQEAKKQEKAVNHLLTVLGDHPEIARVRFGTLHSGLAVEALDEQGAGLPEASLALNQVITNAAVPDLLARQLGDRTWEREAFETEISRPLVAAAVTQRQSPHTPGNPTDLTTASSSDEIDVAGARAWFDTHYSTHKVQGDRNEYAVMLQAALAAEGYDLQAPPQLRDPGSFKLNDEFMSAVGARKELAGWLAMEARGIEEHIDGRAIHSLRACWQIVQDGDYPELINWKWNVGTKSMEAAKWAPKEIGEVRLVGENPQPGVYLPAMRQAAAQEAAEAGLDVQAYLDHLQPVQRRALITGLGPEDPNATDHHYGPGILRAAAYRVAYAKASAAERPQWSTRHELEVSQAQDQLNNDELKTDLLQDATSLERVDPVEQVGQETDSMAWENRQVLSLDATERAALADELRKYAAWREGDLNFDIHERIAELGQDPTYAYDLARQDRELELERQRIDQFSQEQAQAANTYRQLAHQVEQNGQLDLTDMAVRREVIEMIDNHGWQLDNRALESVPAPMRRVVEACLQAPSVPLRPEPDMASQAVSVADAPMALPEEYLVADHGPRWDSQEARDDWAAELVSKGVDPAAVRAARTGDLSRSKPTKATTVKGSTSKSGRRPPKTPHASNSHKPRSIP
ncbi:Uncharacterised protein [Actinomyces bovis]|uniref:Uncharacterized protein n=1 Tax=Actinomyces bovis TaxID=1658 RepID=A0ABY1VQZ4_9ACTO|nr:hypothetical protein [Actinomyces bovis]SPT53473.1 Uncharacterised protein [Actinomyces bovis]VEG55346.1 Uncharacterised protein [Actinomyces israelii]